MMKTNRLKPRKPGASIFKLVLYVTGQTAKSTTALSNLKTFCETYLKGRYQITVIDLIQCPELARSAQILAIPTVIRECPKPTRTMIGDFSHTERLLDRLDLRLIH